eukprot:357152-Chlamydomonas_euryale.AAC.7
MFPPNVECASIKCRHPARDGRCAAARERVGTCTWNALCIQPNLMGDGLTTDAAMPPTSAAPRTAADVADCKSGRRGGEGSGRGGW